MKGCAQHSVCVCIFANLCPYNVVGSRYKDLLLHTIGILEIENSTRVMQTRKFPEWPIDAARLKRPGPFNLTVGMLLNAPFVSYDEVCCAVTLRYIPR